MKNHLRLMGSTRSLALWFVGFAVILVFFPFEWLRNIWPAYALVFDRVFATALAHHIGHTTVFLLAGLLLLSSSARLRRSPLLYATIFMLGAVSEELFQALSKWQFPDIGDLRDIGFDVLGFVLAYLLVWGWWKLRNIQKDRRSKNTMDQRIADPL